MSDIARWLRDAVNAGLDRTATKVGDAVFEEIQRRNGILDTEARMAIGLAAMAALTPPAPGGAPAQGQPLEFDYTNWRGERGRRRVYPLYLWWGSTEWHPESGWLLHATDLDKGAERDFALMDIVFGGQG